MGPKTAVKENNPNVKIVGVTFTVDKDIRQQILIDPASNLEMGYLVHLTKLICYIKLIIRLKNSLDFLNPKRLPKVGIPLFGMMVCQVYY